jgi:hypothetical protein
VTELRIVRACDEERAAKIHTAAYFGSLVPGFPSTACSELHHRFAEPSHFDFTCISAPTEGLMCHAATTAKEKIK